MFEGKNLDLKIEAEEILKIQGHERGTDIKYLVNYAKLKKGEEGHRQIVEALRAIGYELPDIDKLDNMEWIPASLPTIYMVAMAKVFEWTEQDLVDMGKSLMSYSTIMRVFVKFFVSPLQTFKAGAKRWNIHYDFGHGEVTDFTGHSLVFRLSNFKKHKATCYYLLGFFTTIVELGTGSKNVKTIERKCVFNGDDCHEFYFSW